MSKTPVCTTRKWCVYKTTHPKGFYYIGKGLTHKVEAGQYKGSGVKLKAAFLAGYPPEEWTSVVLETFPASLDRLTGKDLGEKDAYNREKQLVTFDTLCDPFCLNSMAGGVGGWKWKSLTSAAVKKRSRAISKALKDKKRGPQRTATVTKRAATLRQPEVAAKLGHSKGKKFPERGAAISAGTAKWEKKQCAACGGMFSPSPYARFHGTNCRHQGQATPTGAN